MEIDKDLAAQIDAEYEAMFGGSKPAAPEKREPAPKPVPLPDIEAPDAWPDTLMFSEAFDAEDFLKDRGLRDLPLPSFQPDDWPEEARPMIPTLPTYWVHNLDVMYALSVFLHGGDTSLMVGPTGSGKTSAVYAFASVLGIPVWLTSCYEGMEDTVFTGSTGLRADPETGANVTEYNPSQLVHSMRHGGINLIDEAMRSTCLMAIQPVLEDKHTLVLADADGLDESERVLVAPEGKWWCILTDNTCGTGDETGSYNAVVQDLSSIDRVTGIIEVPYNDKDVEIAILKRAVPALPEITVNDIVNVGNLMRDAFIRGASLQPMSMRALLAWARKWAVTGDLKYAYMLSFHNKLDSESKSISGEVWNQVFSEEL